MSGIHKFQVLSGIVRCADTACLITQCWKCEKEQNRLKKAGRKQNNSAAAAVIKAAEQDVLCQEARAKIAGGHVFDFSEPEPLLSTAYSQQAVYDDMIPRRKEFISQQEAEVASVVYPSLPDTFEGCNIKL